MLFYLSSYKLGSRPDRLVHWLGPNGTVGYIPNALDHIIDKEQWLAAHIRADMTALEKIGLMPSILDLKDHFGRPDTLEDRLRSLSGVWVCGGNVFVLRQAMRLSGFDKVLRKLEDTDFVYGGYSAGCCVLSNTLEAYQHVDDPDARAYDIPNEPLWEGLGVLPFVFMPHYKSAHSESATIDTEVSHCLQHGIAYRTFRDGEVLVLRSPRVRPAVPTD